MNKQYTHNWTFDIFFPYKNQDFSTKIINQVLCEGNGYLKHVLFV